MLKVIIIGLLAVIYFTALFGWGRLAEKLFRTSRPFPLTICLGMAVWIFLGGILNLLGIAYSLMLDGIVLSGLAFSVLLLVRAWKLKTFSIRKKYYFSKQ